LNCTEIQYPGHCCIGGRIRTEKPAAHASSLRIVDGRRIPTNPFLGKASGCRQAAQHEQQRTGKPKDEVAKSGP
jgi:hypothetical protein